MSAASGSGASGLGRLEPELRVALGFVALALAGWLASSPPLAIAGVLGALTAGAISLWQRHCLTGVSYRRRLSAERVDFGAEVVCEMELVNDKVLPLSWIELEDSVPAALSYAGATVHGLDGAGRRATLVDIRPMLPYQRVVRRVVLSCEHRGEHVLGPAVLRSGDPLGLRQRSVTVTERSRLLVHPKLFVLEPAGLVSRLVVGEQRSRRELLEDPSRFAGVREYRAGDALRFVDWRATARSGALLVRQFEPSVSTRVALVLDPGARVARGGEALALDELELAVALTASLLVELDRRSIPTSLYSTGTVDGRPLALSGASLTPGGIAAGLEALAKLAPFPRSSFAALASGELARVPAGTSVLVVGNDLAAAAPSLAQLRRRSAVTACLVGSSVDAGLPAGSVDGLVLAPHLAGWQQLETFALVTGPAARSG